MTTMEYYIINAILDFFSDAFPLITMLFIIGFLLYLLFMIWNPWLIKRDPDI